MDVIMLLFITLMVGIAVTSGQDCPQQYLRYSSDHSYCKIRNPSCTILATYVTAEDIASILKQHNDYRSNLAIGKESKLPSAANMLQMEWDDELAAVAQKRAEQCDFSHDRLNARRVQNFGVGQNIASEYITNSPNIPSSNWTLAINTWYSEIEYFSQNLIDPFVSPPSNPTYGHFSQLAWAGSWKVGCGYVLYQEGNIYKKLYVCNYGPGGNIVQDSMYKVGDICTACPVNSCCGQSCGGAAAYPGLCKITDGKAPTYKSQESYLFYCDFTGQDDCKFSLVGENAWKTYTTLSGNYLGIVLNEGQSSTITFLNKIVPPSPTFCFTIEFRKGPDVDGQVDSNIAEEKFIGNGFTVPQILPEFLGDQKLQFSKYGMSLGWSGEAQISLSFSVPIGAPAQFFEIKDVFAQDGPCTG